MIYSRNLEIIKGGRKSIKMKLNEFKEKLENEIAEALINKYDIDEENLEDEMIDIGDYVHVVVNLEADCDISFGLEDMSSEEEYVEVDENEGFLSEILGYHEYKGFCWLGCSAGDHNEMNVFFIVYYDGNRFRAYTPLVGNVFNLNTYYAIGNDDVEDDKFKDIMGSVSLMKKDFLSRMEINGQSVINLDKPFIKMTKVPEYELNELLEAIEGLVDDSFILGLVEDFKEKIANNI